MIIVTSNADAQLVESAKSLKGNASDHYALHFHLSQLQEHYRSEFQMRIAINILNDIFRASPGSIYYGRDGDIFVIYHGVDRTLLDKAIFQLRYLFVDDPLANHQDGTENEDFCTMYDLAFQWRLFYRVCTDRLEQETRARVTAVKERREVVGKLKPISPESLHNVVNDIESVDITLALRKQPVCASKTRQDKIRPVFHEVYVNIGHLRQLLGSDCDFLSDRWLFKYLTKILDHHVLSAISERPLISLKTPISLNLNVETLLSPHFKEFDRRVKAVIKPSVVIEIPVVDVYAEMNAFMSAKELAQSLGYRICVDGLTTDSFIQVDREKLGFDLAKLQWNADMVGDLENKENQQLKKAIERCGSNRMILCRCDSHHALEYGHALGISLFQGRYTDRLLDPDSRIIN